MKLLIAGVLALVGSSLNLNHEDIRCTNRKAEDPACRDRQYCSGYGWCEYKTTSNGHHTCYDGNAQCKSGNCVKRSYDGIPFCQP